MIQMETTVGSPPVFLDGDILELVQTARIFPDQKTFTDMNLKTDPGQVLDAFGKLKGTNGVISNEEIRSFIEEYFEGPDSEFEVWTPEDWKERPKILETIEDPQLQNWASHLNCVWKKLGRKIKKDVKDHQERYGLIYLPYPFIIPGGRFRELFYWDTYWTIEGLLQCEMYDTVKGILWNFKHLIDLLGHVPNGSRFSISDRSQPPFLCLMAWRYWEKTKDKQFLLEYISTLEREYEFWVKKRSVTISRNGEKYQLYRYWADTTKPRPESYTEDRKTAEVLSAEKRGELYRNLRAACESGMDFSTRWMPTERTGDGLHNTNTTDVIPVELVSLICMNESIISNIFEIIGRKEKGAPFRDRHMKTKRAIKDVLWNEEAGIWFDVTISTGSHRQTFYPTNIAPVFCGCHHTADEEALKVEGKVFSYLQRCNVLDNVGGVPTSLCKTDHQWDFMNVWPPLQHMVIMSLANMEADDHKQKARELAGRWVKSNFTAWKDTGHMFEKYDANEIGKPGFGGEYEVQIGFGWTNGVILHLLSLFGKEISIE